MVKKEHIVVEWQKKTKSEGKSQVDNNKPLSRTILHTNTCDDARVHNHRTKMNLVLDVAATKVCCSNKEHEPHVPKLHET